MVSRERGGGLVEILEISMASKGADVFCGRPGGKSSRWMQHVFLGNEWTPVKLADRIFDLIWFSNAASDMYLGEMLASKSPRL